MYDVFDDRTIMLVKAGTLDGEGEGDKKGVTSLKLILV